MYSSAEGSSYPFPIVSPYTNPSKLLELLPDRDVLFVHLDMFQRRAQSCSFPHTPDEVTKKEVERFLADREGNAVRNPDMLALIFATLATGLQMGQYDRSGRKWLKVDIERAKKDGDAFSKFILYLTSMFS